MNRVGCAALGIPLDSQFGMPWIPLLASEVHDLAKRALSEAIVGGVQRFSGISGSGETLVHWDNVLTPVRSEDGSLMAILCVSRDMTPQARLQAELTASLERERLLALEMRHRIKNLFALVGGLIAITRRDAQENNEMVEFPEVLEAKIHALSRATEATFQSSAWEDGDVPSLDFGHIATAVLAPYQGRVTIRGPQIMMQQISMTTLALLLHELATNAVKYGAIGTERGSVNLDWRRNGDDLVINWTEICEPARIKPPTSVGFGTKTMTRFARGIGGTISFEWRPEGLAAQILVPLENPA